MKYMYGLKRLMGGGLRTGKMLQMTRDQKVWKSMIANVFNDTSLRYSKVSTPLTKQPTNVLVSSRSSKPHTEIKTYVDLMSIIKKKRFTGC